MTRYNRLILLEIGTKWSNVYRFISTSVMILHYNTTLTPSSKAIYSGTKYYDTHIEFHSLFLDVSSTDV